MIRWINGNRGGDNYRQHKYEKSQHRELKFWNPVNNLRHVYVYIRIYVQVKKNKKYPQLIYRIQEIINDNILIITILIITILIIIKLIIIISH